MSLSRKKLVKIQINLTLFDMVHYSTEFTVQTLTYFITMQKSEFFFWYIILQTLW